MKTKFISISLILLISLTGCFNIEAPQKDRDIADVPETKQEPKDQPCDFSKEIDLKQAENYDQFGSEEFQTVVCGYFTSNQEEIFGETYNIAYFNLRNSSGARLHLL